VTEADHAGNIQKLTETLVSIERDKLALNMLDYKIAIQDLLRTEIALMRMQQGKTP
jgi:hypothetical protein